MATSFNAQDVASVNSEQSTQRHRNKEEIIVVFNRAILLNENFKASVGLVPFKEHSSQRKHLEKFHEDTLSYAMSDCVLLLLKHENAKLLGSFFDVYISYSNSADEQLGFTLLDIFNNNPDLFLKTFKTLSHQGKTYVYKNIKYFWDCFLTDKDKLEKKYVYRTTILKELKKKIKNPFNLAG